MICGFGPDGGKTAQKVVLVARDLPADALSEHVSERVGDTDEAAERVILRRDLRAERVNGRNNVSVFVVGVGGLMAARVGGLGELSHRVVGIARLVAERVGQRGDAARRVDYAYNLGKDSYAVNLNIDEKSMQSV